MLSILVRQSSLASSEARSKLKGNGDNRGLLEDSGKTRLEGAGRDRRRGHRTGARPSAA